MSHPTTRRFFIGAATAAAATRVWGANDKINVAIVGLGGRGTNHLDEYSTRVKDARVAALCDIDQAAREKAQGPLAEERQREGQRIRGHAAGLRRSGRGRRLHRHARTTGTRWRRSGR